MFGHSIRRVMVGWQTRPDREQRRPVQLATVPAVARNGKLESFGSRVEALDCGGKKKTPKR
jgi:hypothetical protein